MSDSCPCPFYGFTDEDRAAHDRLLAFGGEGFTGAAALAAWISGGSDYGPVVTDLPAFVAHHNWPDPSAVATLVDIVVEGVEYRSRVRPEYA